MRSSTITTKPAMITIYEAILTFRGINFLRDEIRALEKVRTKVVASPIARPFLTAEVTARVGQSHQKMSSGE